jgi:hypothetical protein
MGQTVMAVIVVTSFHQEGFLYKFLYKEILAVSMRVARGGWK